MGASDENDVSLHQILYPLHSNFGAPVDILAPGLNVRTEKASPLVTMTGTSPAAALVAGACLPSFPTIRSSRPLELRVRSKQPPEFAATGPRILRTIVRLQQLCPSRRILTVQ